MRAPVIRVVAFLFYLVFLLETGLWQSLTFWLGRWEGLNVVSELTALAIVAGSWLVLRRGWASFEKAWQHRALPNLLVSTSGAVFGLIFISFILGFSGLGAHLSFGAVLVVYMGAMWLGYHLIDLHAEQVVEFFRARFADNISLSNAINQRDTARVVDSKLNEPSQLKLLDTSAIIDGRIVDISRTGFLNGPLIVPDFVIQELQQIADSGDLLKRNRGRRGLDMLHQLQREAHVDVRIQEFSLESGDVDTRLVKLAKTWQAKIVTNDYNLNKVCELHRVQVLNVNDLANSLKPTVLPGEALSVQVLKDGKEHGQGIGYLDDGTMIVVECGREWIGQTIDVLVTSVLQTSAGKMIFSKYRHSDEMAYEMVYNQKQ